VAKSAIQSQDNDEQVIDYSYLPDLIGHLLSLAYLRANQLCTEMMEPLQLTPKQFVALEFISKNPSISQKNIAENIGTAPTVMVGILDSLSKRGLVHRVRSQEDRRKHHVRLTPAGKGLLEEIRRLAFKVEHIYKDETGLTKSEWDMVRKLLRKMTNRQPSNSSEDE